MESSAQSGGGGAPVFYLIDSTQAVLVGTDSSNLSGYVQQQTGGPPFSTATISGSFFFGGGAPTTGGSYDSGTVTFTAGSPSGTITGTDDSSSPNNNSGCTQNCGGGLNPNSPINGNGGAGGIHLTDYFCVHAYCPGTSQRGQQLACLDHLSVKDSIHSNEYVDEHEYTRNLHHSIIVHKPQFPKGRSDILDRPFFICGC